MLGNQHVNKRPIIDSCTAGHAPNTGWDFLEMGAQMGYRTWQSEGGGREGREHTNAASAGPALFRSGRLVGRNDGQVTQLKSARELSHSPCNCVKGNGG